MKLKLNITYDQNKEKRSTVCHIQCRLETNYMDPMDLRVSSESRCHPDDEWDDSKGMKVAESKAMIKLRKLIRVELYKIHDKYQTIVEDIRCDIIKNRDKLSGELTHLDILKCS